MLPIKKKMRNYFVCPSKSKRETILVFSFTSFQYFEVSSLQEGQCWCVMKTIGMSHNSPVHEEQLSFNVVSTIWKLNISHHNGTDGKSLLPKVKRRVCCLRAFSSFIVYSVKLNGWII